MNNGSKKVGATPQEVDAAIVKKGVDTTKVTSSTAIGAFEQRLKDKANNDSEKAPTYGQHYAGPNAQVAVKRKGTANMTPSTAAGAFELRLKEKMNNGSKKVGATPQEVDAAIVKKGVDTTKVTSSTAIGAFEQRLKDKADNQARMLKLLTPKGTIH